MSHNSKQILSGMVTTAILFIAYIIYALGSNAPAADDFKSWAISILVFIGIGVVAIIIVQIVFHIILSASIAIKEGEKEVERVVASYTLEDERDKLIRLKADRIGYICAGFSLVSSLILLAFGHPPIWLLHILFGSFALSSLIEGAVSVYFYEKGMKNA